MATFSQLKSYLGDWLAVDTNRLTDTQRGLLINQAMRELMQLHDLRFGEISATIATVVGTRAYDLPTGFSRPLKVWYLSSTGVRADVDQISREKFIVDYPDPDVDGDPTDFTIWGSQILFGPTPDEALTVNVEYYRLPADLAADADTNAFTTDFYEPILWRAISEATKYLIEDPRAPLWEQKARDTEQLLLIQHGRMRYGATRPISNEPG